MKPPPTGSVAVATLLLATLGVVAYLNSFAAPFLFDDETNLALVRRGLFDGEWIRLSGSRPVVMATLAANQTLGGSDPRGYHLVNLVIHIGAGLALFGVVWRTLELRREHRPAGEGSMSESVECAFWIAAVWLVHPLQTESVTYIIQRAESLMGLCLVGMLYALVRSATSRPGWAWQLAALVLCGLGFGSKEVMVVAPVVAVMYDRQFLSPTWTAALRARWLFYGGCVLPALWLLPRVLAGLRDSRSTVGFAVAGVSPVDYIRSQPEVILRYLQLVVWPTGQCLDYGWPVTKTWIEAAPAMIAVALLLLVAAGLWLRGAVAGWLGLVFFLVLAPTSSIVPIADLYFEHRMYVPLAAVVALLVGAIYRATDGGGERLVVRRGVLGVAVAALLGLTIARNQVYSTDLAMWDDVVQKAPWQSRGWHNRGRAYERRQNWALAEADYRRALGLREAWYSRLGLAVALERQGKYQEALPHCRKSLDAHAGYPATWRVYADLLRHAGREREAEAALQKAEALEAR